MAPIRGHSLLVVPISMVMFNDYSAVATVMVPAAMQPPIMFIELCARPAIIAIVIAVAADADTKALSARDSWRCNRDGR